jgi:cobalamin synthase
MRSALAFLTVLPIAAGDGAPGERLGRAVFPAVGLLLGLAAWVALWLGSLC